MRAARCSLWIVAAAWILSPIASAQSVNRLDATSLTGYFTMAWGDPAPESIALFPLHEYVITDSEGQSTRLDIPIYGVSETNAGPGGETRRVLYSLKSGEATWQLKIEREESAN